MDNKTDQEFSRFDIPELFAAVIDAYGCDTKDVYALAMTHGDDFRSAASEVVDWAFAGRHCYEGKKHEATARAFDALCVALNKAEGFDPCLSIRP